MLSGPPLFSTHVRRCQFSKYTTRFVASVFSLFIWSLSLSLSYFVYIYVSFFLLKLRPSFSSSSFYYFAFFFKPLSIAFLFRFLTNNSNTAPCVKGVCIYAICIRWGLNPLPLLLFGSPPLIFLLFLLFTHSPVGCFCLRFRTINRKIPSIKKSFFFSLFLFTRDDMCIA